MAVLISITVLTGAAAVRLQPAEAQFRGANGRIAFVHSSAEFLQPQLYLMNPDGSGQQRISNGGYHYDPAWSEDGREVAFAWADNSSSDIWVAREDGSERRQVTSGTAYDFSPAWSPTGQSIAFDRYSDPSSPETDVYRVSSTGGTPANLTNHPGNDGEPSWSPDGSRIAFSSDRSPQGVYVMNADGSDQQLVAPAGFSPDWSPNGSRIAYVAVTYEPPAGPVRPTGPPPPPQPRDHLWVVDADGADRHELTYSPGTESAPSWSPDGTKIAYHGLVVDRNEVFVLDLSSGTKTQLTQEGNASPAWQPLYELVHEAPSCRVPRVVGMRLKRARVVIRHAYCSVGRIRRTRSRRPKNIVIRQRPKAGKWFGFGHRAPVRLTVSRGHW